MERAQAQVERYSGIHKNLREETAPIEMLFGLESTMGRCWVDVGFLQFFIRKDDLEKRNFDNTYCEVANRQYPPGDQGSTCFWIDTAGKMNQRPSEYLHFGAVFIMDPRINGYRPIDHLSAVAALYG